MNALYNVTVVARSREAAVRRYDFRTAFPDVNQVLFEEIDLRSLAASLRRMLGRYLTAGYLDGKTILRDAVAAQLGCSDFQAEELVETLELNGFVRFPRLLDDTHPVEDAVWDLTGGQR